MSNEVVLKSTLFYSSLLYPLALSILRPVINFFKNFASLYVLFEKVVGDTEIENYFPRHAYVFEAAFCQTLVEKNCQNGELRKRSVHL